MTTQPACADNWCPADDEDAATVQYRARYRCHLCDHCYEEALLFDEQEPPAGPTPEDDYYAAQSDKLDNLLNEY